MVKRSNSDPASAPAAADPAGTPTETPKVAPQNAPQNEPIYGPGTFTRENSVGYLMRRVVHLMVNEVDHRLADGGLTHAQWTPLFLIHRGQANTLAALARDLQLDAGALTRTLDRLEAKGLCRRDRSADDRRVIHLTLTPEGEKAAAPVPGVLCDVSNTMLQGFSREEWETLMGFLRRMVANVETLKAPLPTTVPERHRED
ncbi:MarR family winged helix-turn-helix transcriptional regulator [Aquabacterium sp.]|jgi:DNA-binding MarR family transcriptional regulator|uniref:MarR family winged helix-turn-helix transcriptional regulator n=1 Tax=Aquabacterium sp. TaxID=1872578 RepID=UPI0024890636|nr:MarR family winged helix-turn-helix transcriptional regulator [Aquabacterium sp.]MDI1350458.1 MarR family winged helix-turn-helix transcriptional regulator [Aquabacterium sp.]